MDPFRVPMETIEVRDLSPRDLADFTPIAQERFWTLEQQARAQKGMDRKLWLDRFIIVVSAPITIPLGILIAAIGVDSSGPVIYRQERVGLHGEPFTIYKFRTMRDESDGSKTITRRGRLLRTLHLDELPNLWNVFRGEMSIVGPRPHILEEVESHNYLFPQAAFRHLVRPGIAGQAANLLGYNNNLLQHLEYDLAYVRDVSVRHDLRILGEKIRRVYSNHPY